MADITNTQIDAAGKRGRAAAAIEPRASSVYYSHDEGLIVLHLVDGCSFSFPPSKVQGLEHATAAQLHAVKLLGNGFGLHWPQPEVDVTVPGLLAGVFGTAAFMARRAGSATSPAKAAAARRNGVRGGRPRKVAVPA